MKYILLFLCITFQINAFAQTQIGQDINGEAAYDLSGTSISLSADGKMVAIGAKGNDGNGSYSGHTRVYRITDGIWSQVGDDIDGEASGDASGTSVSLSADGTIVAIGATGNNNLAGHVRVYRLTSGNWSQLGSDIDGDKSEDYFGNSVSLSADGTVVAIGARYNHGNGWASGQVRVLEFKDGAWSQLGSDIYGEAELDNLGASVSLSADGTVVAAGAPGNDGNGDISGHVRVFKFTNGSWIQMGSDIDGEAAWDMSGTAVSLSADGTVVAIGAENNKVNNKSTGHVRVYKFTGTSWSQLGDDIDGDPGDKAGSSVSLSADGTVVAIGAVRNDNNGSGSGNVRIYEYSGGSWSQVGVDINGQEWNEKSGTSVSLSEDGTMVAIGSPGYAGNGIDSGRVRVFGTGKIVSIADEKLSSLSFFPNPVKDVITISNPQNLELAGCSVYDVMGRLVQKVDLFNQNTIDLSNLRSASYLVVITSKNGNIARKIVKE
jgi:hypothetical protein